MLRTSSVHAPLVFLAQASLRIAVFGLLLGVSSRALAVVDTWSGATNSSWGTSGNWVTSQPGGIPLTGDTIQFDSTGNSGVTFPNTDNNLGSIATPFSIATLNFASGAGSYNLTSDAPVNDVPLLVTTSLIDQANGSTETINYQINPTSPAGTLFMGSPTPATPDTNGSATLVLNASSGFTALTSSTNNGTGDAIQLGNNSALTVNGNILVGGYNPAAASTSKLAIAGTTLGTGSLTDTGTTNTLVIGGVTNAPTTALTATLDLSGLSSFSFTGQEVDVAGNLSTSTGAPTGNRVAGTLTLAANSNAITVSGATGVSVGGGSPSNGGNGQLHLSGTGTNTIWTPVLSIGSVKSQGTVDFSSTGAGTLTLRGATGGTSRATVVVGNHTGAGTASAKGTLNLTGHSIDVMASTFTVGLMTASQTNATITSQASFDSGTFDATTVILGQKTGTAVGAPVGILTMGGGSLIVNSLGGGGFALGSNPSTSTGAGQPRGQFVINGGTATIHSNIVVGPLTGTLSTVGATGEIDLNGNSSTPTVLDMTGFSIATTTVPLTTFNVPTGGNTATIQNLGGTGIVATGGTGGTGGLAGLTMGDGGTLILAGNNTYTGVTNINSGTVQLNSATPAVNSLINVAGGNLTFGHVAGVTTYQIGGLATTNTGNVISLQDSASNPITLQIGAQGSVSTTPALTSYAGQLTGSGGLTLAGTNGTTTFALTNVNNYTGNTLISGGTLSVTGGGQLYAAGGAGTVTINTGGTLTGSTPIGTPTVNTKVTLNSGTIAPDAGNVLTLKSLTMGGGTLKFTLTGSSLSEIIANGAGLTTTLSAGSLSFATLGSVSPNATPYTILDASAGTLINSLTFANPYIVGASTFTVSKVGNTLQVLVTGSPSNLTWVGANASGAWDVITTKNWNNTSTSTNPDFFHNVDSVWFDDTSSHNTVNITAAVQPTAVTFNNTSAHNYVINSSTSNGIGDPVSVGGQATLTMNSSDGTGSATLNTVNTYTGNTTVQSGTLIVGSTGSIASTNINVSGGGPTALLKISGSVSTKNINLSNNGSIEVTSTGLLTGGAGTIVSVNNSSGNGFVVDSGAALPSTLVIDNEGTTIINSSQSIASLTGTNSSAVLKQAGTLTTNSNSTYQGVIADVNSVSNKGALTVAGGTLLLKGVNTYTGATTINSGATLQIDDGSSNTGSLSNSTAITDNGTLIFDRSDSPAAISNTISNTAGPTPTGLIEVNPNTGTIILSGNNSGFTGTTAVYSGTLQQGSANALGASTVALQVGQPTGPLGNTTTGNLVLTTSTQVGSFAALSASTTVGAGAPTSLVTIPTGSALTVNGAFLIGPVNTTGNLYDNTTNFAGGGSLVVNAGAGNFVVGQASTNAGAKDSTSSDMSALNSLSVNTTGIFAVGYGSNTRATLLLPDTIGAGNPSNSINASEIDVGNSLSDNNVSSTPSTLTLGQGTNVLHANTINIGLGKTGGLITWSGDATSTSSVNIAGTGGGSAVANIIVSGQNSSTSGNVISTLSLAGHVATVQAGSLGIGENIGNTAGAANGVVTFDTGTFDTGTVTIGASLSASATGATGTLIVGGNAVTNVNSGATGVFSVHGGVILGEVVLATAPTTLGTATLGINGGTTNIGGAISTTTTIGGVVSATPSVTSTLNLEAGILNMAGNGIGSSTSPITNMNILDQGNSSVVLANLGGNGIYASGGNAASTSGGLTVPSAGGVLILDGSNTYLHGTTINGTLQLGQASSPALASPVGDASGAVTVNGSLNFASNSTMVIANSLTGSGTINQNGNGTTTTSGNGSSFAGSVAVNSGVLSVTGSLSSVSQALAVNSGGTLSGTGTIVGNISVSGGTVLPGTIASPQGTLTSSGQLNDNGGILSFVAGPGGIGKISVANAEFNGSTPTLAFSLSGMPTTGVFTILSSTNHFTGDGGLASLAPVSAGRTTFTPSESGPGNSIVVNISGGPATLTWNNSVGSGNGSSWDVQGQNNWKRTDAGSVGNANQYYQFDNVTFDDVRTGGNTSGHTVNITTAVTPLSINVNTASTYTFNGTGSIGGSTGITLTGGGTLSLATNGPTPNNYTGTTTITNGTLQVATAGALPTGATISMASAGKLDLDGNTATIGSISGTGGAIGNSGGSLGTLNYASLGSNTFSGTISDTLGSGSNKTALTLSAGSLLLTGSNTYTGNTTISSGTTLQIGNGSSSGSLSGTTSIVDNGQLIYNLTSSPVIANNISGIGPVVQSGSGTLVLTGANSYGQTIINSGTVQVGNGTATGTPGLGNVTINGNTVIFDRSDSPTFSSNISGTTGGLIKNIGGGTTTLTGTISGAVSLQQNSGGTLILPNNNTYTGGTTVANGTLQVSGSGGASALGTGDVTVNAGGTLVGANGDAFGFDSGNPTAGGPASPLNINVNGGTITDLGTGNYRITLPDLNFTGGTLTSNAANLGDANGQFSFQGQQTTGATPSTGPALVTTNAASTTVVFNAPKIAVQSPTIFNVAAGSVVSGPTPGVDLLISSSLIPYNGTAHSITKNGTGVMELSGVNTYTLSTIVNQGTLKLGVANSINTTSQVALAGGTLNTSGFAQFPSTGSVTTLALTSGSHLDMGLGGQSGGGAVHFAASSTSGQSIIWSGTLSVDNWTPGIDHLFVGTSAAGLDPTQVSDITFTGFGAAQILSTGEIVPQVAVPTFTLGDVNGDGHYNVADILAEEKALTDIGGYALATGPHANPYGIALNTDEMDALLDQNHDGLINNQDIQALINNLLAGQGSATGVPEPTSLLLFGLGGTLLLAKCARRKFMSSK